jgi:putative transposase
MARRKEQLSFFRPAAKSFGGGLLKGNPKGKRPLSTKNPVHLVLKSKRAFGSQSMLDQRHVARIDQLVRRQAKFCGIKIYHFVNVGNHLHLVLRVCDRRLYFKFIRSISGLIARQVLQRERGPKALCDDLCDDQNTEQAASLKRSSFWMARPFTRVAAWGLDYLALSKYMDKNRAQAKSLDTRMTEKLGRSVLGFDLQISFFNTA